MGGTGGIHRASTRVLALLMTIIGIALIVQSLTGHAGVISGRLLLGVLFVAAGVGRLYVESRRGGSG